MDNAPGHYEIIFPLNKLKIIFLPPNTSSIIQPLDAGIIASFKKRYKYKLLHKTVELLPNQINLQSEGAKLPAGTAGLSYCYPAHLMDACELARDSWSEISCETIQNCWIKSGLVSITTEDIIKKNLPSDQSQSQIRSTNDDEVIEQIITLLNSTSINSPINVPQITNIVNEWINVETNQELINELVNQELANDEKNQSQPNSPTTPQVENDTNFNMLKEKCHTIIDSYCNQFGTDGDFESFEVIIEKLYSKFRSP